jgi:hypothetical protein
MQVVFHCPGCEQARRTSVTADSGIVRCEACTWSRPLREGDVAGGVPRRCVVCDCGDLWRQKDFPQRLGLAMVALGAILSTIAWAYHLPATALGVLLAFALADLLLFAFMKDVLVCYRCQARYRHAELGEDYPRFSLETAERYRQEAARLAESRRSPVRHATGSPS